MKKAKALRITACLTLVFFIILCNFDSVFAETNTSLRAQQVDLNILWEVRVGTKDGMTTANYNEATPYTMLGQMYYVPKDNDATRNQLYRLNSGTDHMMSTSTNEGGYALEGGLGFAWKNAYKPVGTNRMRRGFNSGTSDHATMSREYTISGYSVEEFADDYYAYNRYGGDATKMYQLTGSAIDIKSNLVAGGALWNWTWNGKQFLDTLDYGREMQASLSFPGTQALPTEAGDAYYNANAQFMHGSPILSYSNTTTTASKIQSTRAIPLEWSNTAFNGNLVHTPSIYYQWYLGKDIKLDDTSLDLGSAYNYLRSQVAKYTTVLYTPNGFTNGGIEIPTAYMKSEFKRAFTFDSTVTDLNLAAHEVVNNEFTDLGGGVYHYQYNPTCGGVIYATTDLQYAMGVYGANPINGGDVDYCTLWKFGNINSPSVTKWSAAIAPTNVSAGEVQYSTYIISGTYDDVRTAMRRLYLMGYR